MTTLTHVVTQQQNQRQVRDVTIVEKPQAFKGDTSEAARLFRYVFQVWARGNMRAFALRNPDGTYQLDAAGDKVPDEGAMIASALSFMQGTAGQWARPHLETIADNGVAFQNSSVVSDQILNELLAIFGPPILTVDKPVHESISTEKLGCIPQNPIQYHVQFYPHF